MSFYLRPQLECNWIVLVSVSTKYGIFRIVCSRRVVWVPCVLPSRLVCLIICTRIEVCVDWWDCLYKKGLYTCIRILVHADSALARLWKCVSNPHLSVVHVLWFLTRGLLPVPARGIVHCTLSRGKELRSLLLSSCSTEGQWFLTKGLLPVPARGIVHCTLSCAKDQRSLLLSSYSIEGQTMPAREREHST